LTEETSPQQQTNYLSGDMQGIPDWTRVAQILERLVLYPPKVLLLEGGTAGERERVALYWAAGLNCTEVQKPCARCLLCRRVFGREFTDLHYLDGLAGRIGIDAVRELRPLLGQAPRDGGRRVIMLGEAQELTPEAANALLKSMEDSDVRNSFVLLVPQRERLLPTLVSRSWVLTLGWYGALRWTSTMPGEKERSAENKEWLEAMAAFLHSGQGWFARTMVKSQVDKTLAAGLIIECRRSLIQAMLGSPQERLALLFYEQGSPQLWRDLDLRLHQAEQGLMAQVSPALVLDWLVTGMRLRMRWPRHNIHSLP
jgi:DNA polymerase-3 subunit delta'